ncbi:MAG: hypothetical protein JNM07_01765 [Phycisphaerae bacterium]|nr:hypothetical protein [Phycisphaerae bacterium]
MSHSFGALCSDFYINSRLNLKMDLPSGRETVLALFDRIRKERPEMSGFRRYSNELALESEPQDGRQSWVALRRTSLRAGVANPERTEEAYSLHRMVLEMAPYFLSISPLDVDFVELMYGFDLPAAGNHDSIIFEALLEGSAFARLLTVPGARPVDCQPVFGLSLNDEGDLQAHFEVKTRSGIRHPKAYEANAQPISIFLTLRRYGEVTDVRALGTHLDTLAAHGEKLVEDRLVPDLLVPIREAIGTGRE